MKFVYFIVQIYINAIWVFPSPFQLITALIIYKEFGLFCKSLEHKTGKDGQFSGCLEEERRRYIQMVRIVEAADKCLFITETY